MTTYHFINKQTLNASASQAWKFIANTANFRNTTALSMNMNIAGKIQPEKTRSCMHMDKLQNRL